jgi:hypothetical protein
VLLIVAAWFSSAKYLAAIAGLGATLAAGFDVWENVAILKVLSAPATPDNDPLVGFGLV